MSTYEPGFRWLNPGVIKISIILLWCQVYGQEYFCLGRSMRFAELEFSVEYNLVRAPPSWGGSNTPRPAVFVPHIDVNADGCRARQARSSKNTACRGGISEISDVSLDHVGNAWMIYKIGIISKRYLMVFGVLRWHNLER